MGRRIEYVEQNVILTCEEIEDIMEYNSIAKNEVGNLSGIQHLANLLTGLNPIFNRILKKAELSITPLKVAKAMFNAYVGLAADEVDGVKQCLDNGYESLEAIYDDMKTNNWTKVKMDIPWLEFVDEGLRAVQGNCLVSQYYKNGAWHDLNKLYT